MYIAYDYVLLPVGDLHGDLIKTLNALSLAGVLKQDDDGAPLWCGGDTIVVQLGDVLDRGDCEIGQFILAACSSRSVSDVSKRKR